MIVTSRGDRNSGDAKVAGTSRSPLLRLPMRSESFRPSKNQELLAPAAPDCAWFKSIERDLRRRARLEAECLAEFNQPAALSTYQRGKSVRTTRATAAKADYTLRAARGNVELAPGRVFSTTLYNGQFPGPLLRFTEGKRTIVDIYNDTDIPEVAHWHGQMIPSEVDGAIEEGTPVIPPHGMRRISFTPKPSGFRFLHTHVMAGSDLGKGTYSGQAAPVYIEPKANVGAYDREVVLILKEFEPSFSHGGAR